VANATWPATLPQTLPLTSGVTLVDPRVQSQREKGPPKFRRRTTSTRIEYPNVTLLLREHQWDALRSFFVDELSGGSARFDWDEPWLGAGTRSFFFLTPPRQTSGVANSTLPGLGAVYATFSLLEVLS
jgi:hypothetical protein